MVDLSIIIPIYNTPTEALQRCFTSIETLGNARYEVLLIDDGSKPFVGEFCRAYVANRPAFRYVHKENGGVSSARNLGLDMASGNYISFLDADDILLGDPIARALETATEDLVLFDTQVEEKGVTNLWSAFEQASGEVPVKTLLEVLVTSPRLNGPYAKLYKSTLLQEHHTRFDTTFVTGEDWEFTCRFVLCATTVTYCKESTYLYYRDGGNAKSRVKRFPDTMLDNTIAMYRKKEQIVSQRFPKEEHPALLNAAAVSLIENLFNTAADMLLLGNLTRPRKTRLLDACAQASVHLLPEASGKTRKKAWILEHCFVAVAPLACLRELYLRIKK